MSKVFVENCKDYEYIDEAMNNIIASFDVLRNIKKDSKVVIKANLVTAMAPQTAATTDYRLVMYLVNYLVSKGCKVVVGDSPSGIFDLKRLKNIYNVTKYNLFNDYLNYDVSSVVQNQANLKVLKSFEYANFLKDADLIINFAKLKTHGMMGMSAAVKNMFGSIPGTLKLEYHYRYANYEDFANMLVDLNEFFHPQVNIVDAVIGMEGNGPTAGTPKKIGYIIAGESSYEVDYVCSKIIGIDYKFVDTINASVARNLLDINNLQVNKDLSRIQILDFDTNMNKKSILFYSDKSKVLSKFIKVFLERKPYLRKSKCIGCQRCMKNCPAKAISMKNKKPVIERNKCIKCYCCQEFCPVGAMVVKKSIVSKILRNKK